MKFFNVVAVAILFCPRLGAVHFSDEPLDAVSRPDCENLLLNPIAIFFATLAHFGFYLLATPSLTALEYRLQKSRALIQR